MKTAFNGREDKGAQKPETVTSEMGHSVTNSAFILISLASIKLSSCGLIHIKYFGVIIEFGLVLEIISSAVYDISAEKPIIHLQLVPQGVFYLDFVAFLQIFKEF